MGTMIPIEPIKELLSYNLSNGRIENNLNNRCLILENDSNFKGKIRNNELSGTPYVFGGMVWDSNRCNYRAWKNIDDSNLYLYLDNTYNLRYNKELTQHAISIVAHKHSFNPITEYLESIAWDGRAHVENLLHDYLGAEKNEYNTTVIKLFMLGLCARAYIPGRKFEIMPVLKGSQGDGKSTFCRLLALDDEWFTDDVRTVDGERPKELIRGKWVVEMAELTGFKRAKDQEAIKQFISCQADRYRGAYATRSEDYPRSCGFIGTTNEEQFLADRTGNRRFFPIETNATKETKARLFDKSAIEEFKQAWGEIVALYKDLVARDELRLVIPDNLQSQVEKVQSKYLEEDTDIGAIEKYLEDKNEVCIRQIWFEALGNERNPKRQESNNIVKLITNDLNWYNTGERMYFGEYGRQSIWKPRDEWRAGEFGNS